MDLVKGLTARVLGSELIPLIEAQSKYRSGSVPLLEGQIKELMALREQFEKVGLGGAPGVPALYTIMNSSMGMNPGQFIDHKLETLEQTKRENQHEAGTLAFFADHITPTAVYELGESDLKRLAVWRLR
jgi:hypothetical protein